ncbi:MAG: hypothetical protein JXB35_04985 [Anaerolineae bacterium]|nr:hypothetical protein [Anaerolineae bacterium]
MTYADQRRWTITRNPWVVWIVGAVFGGAGAYMFFRHEGGPMGPILFFLRRAHDSSF